MNASILTRRLCLAVAFALLLDQPAAVQAQPIAAPAAPTDAPDNLDAVRAQIDQLQSQYEAPFEAGDFAAAADIVERAAALQERLSEEPADVAAGSWMWAADLRSRVDDMARAVAAAERGCRILQHAPGAPPWMVVDAELTVEYMQQIAKLPAAVRARLLAAAGHVDTAAAAYDAGELEAALDELNAALAIRREALGDEHVETAKNLLQVGQLTADLGDPEAALDLLEQAAAIQRTALGADHPQYAETLTVQAQSESAVGRLDAAKEHLQAALAVQRKAFGDDDFDVVETIDALAHVHFELAEYDPALALFQEAWATIRRMAGPEDPLAAKALSNLGLVHRNLGDFSEARRCYGESLRIHRAALGARHLDTARVQDNLGELLTVSLDFVAARRHLEEALAVRRELLGDDHLDVGDSLLHLGGFRRAVGDISAAKEAFGEALQIAVKSAGPASTEAATAQGNLGMVLQDLGDYAGALPILQRSYETLRNELGEDHPDVASALSQLGILADSMGDLPTARDYFQRALNVTNAALGEQHLETADRMGDLGMVMLAQGEHDSATEMLHQALRIREAIVGGDHVMVAASLSDLSAAAYELDDLPAAREYSQRCLKIYQRHLGPGHPNAVAALGQLASVLHDQGETALAREKFEESLRLMRLALGDDHPEVAYALGNLAIVAALAGEYDEAVDRLAAARAIERRVLETQLYRLSEANMRKMVDGAAGSFDLLASLPLESMNRTDDGAAALLFDKALAFDVLNRRRGFESLAANDPEVARLRSELLAAQRTLESTAVGSGQPTPEQAARLAELRELCTRLENELSSVCAKYLGDTSTLDVSLAKLRKRLPADGVLVEFVRHEQLQLDGEEPKLAWLPARYVAVVITADDDAPAAWIDLGPAEGIDALVDALGEMMREFPRFASHGADEQSLEADYRDAARQLGAKVFKPLTLTIGERRRVFLGPDSRLHETPFEALVSDSGKYLLEEGYLFDYLNSGRDLLRTAAPDEGQGVLVFAGPNYNLPYERRLALAEVLKVDETAMIAGLDAEPDRGERASVDATNSPMSRAVDTRRGWRHLPGAAIEGEEAAAAFTAAGVGPVRAFTGDEALEELVKQVHSPRVLILVTHGDFLADEPARRGGVGRGGLDAGSSRGGARAARIGLRAAEDPMLRSYLVFAGANRLDELPPDAAGDNGWLTAREIAALDLLGTDLVVLSACNTSRGRAANGQAVVGMRSAFLFAGAQTIVGSLYEVPDAETRELMGSFYQGVAAGRGKLDSLNAAKLAFLAERRAREGTAHPFYWASLVLVGEP